MITHVDRITPLMPSFSIFKLCSIYSLPTFSHSLSSSFGVHFSFFPYCRDMEDVDKRNNRLATVLEASVPFLQVGRVLRFVTTQNEDTCSLRLLNSFFYTCIAFPLS